MIAMEAGTGTAHLDFTVTNPTFAAYVGSGLAIGYKAGTFYNTGGNADGSLTLGSNSTLVVGTPAARADLTIGLNNAGGTATGLLDARQGTIDLHLTNLNVGYASGIGTGVGTLRWDRPVVIDATNVYFGRGGGTGILDVPAGGTFLLGTAANPISALGIGYNDRNGGGTGTAHLDLTVTNPTFAAYVGSDLAIGYKAGTFYNTGGNADGSLILGSNSTLVVGTPAARADLNIGLNNAGGAATGLLDARQGTIDLHLTNLNVGYASGIGTGVGTLRWDRPVVIDATNVYFGRGAGTGILDVPAGGTFLLGTAADPISALGIGYNDRNGGGTGTAHLDLTVTNPTFAAYVGSGLAIGYKAGTFYNTGGNADGSLTLGSNSTLVVGTPAARADLTIGLNNAGGAATGLLDARQGTIDLHLTNLNVGYASGIGTGVGTLRWDRPVVIDATNVYFGRGGGTGILDVPAGGTFLLGTAANPISALGIGYNDRNGGGTGTAHLDLTVTNPTFAAYVGSGLAIGYKAGTFYNTGGNADGSLTLGSNSTLVVGTPAARADLTIGLNNAGGAATGLLDARQGTIDLHLTNLNVGYASGIGTGVGTLRWDRPVVIDATNVYFGRGGGTGILDVPAGGTFLLGTAANPISALGIGYNDRNGGGTGTAHLDLTVTNPTFAAYVGSGLAIGYKAGTFYNTGGNADGSLTLGSNSTLVVGTPAARADLTIGLNNAGGAATGLLDARQGTIDLHLTNLNVGYASGIGTATGTMTMGNGSRVDATTVNIGAGANASGTFNLTGGLLIAQTINVGAGDAFSFTGGRLAAGTFNNTLNVEGLKQEGGTLAPGNTSPGRTIVNGNYNLWSPGTLEIQLDGLTAASQYDQLVEHGLVNLNFDLGAGGKLDTMLEFTPKLGDMFTILDNDGIDPISGFFGGLAEGTTFTEAFGGDVFTFGITYRGGTGNDIVLTVLNESPTGVPEPTSLLLLVLGLGVVGMPRMRRMYRCGIAARGSLSPRHSDETLRLRS